MANGFRQKMNCQMGIIYMEESIGGNLSCKGEEYDRSRDGQKRLCGNSCTERFYWKGWVEWLGGGLLKRTFFALCVHVMQYMQDVRKGREEWIGDDTCYTIYMENTDAHYTG